MRDAGSIQFDARPRASDPAAMSIWSDVTVSAADGGVRIVALNFAEKNSAKSSSSVVSEVSEAIAAHDAIVGAAANVPQKANESEGGAVLATTKGASTEAGKLGSASPQEESQAECDRVLAIAIALSPPPAVAVAFKAAELTAGEMSAPSTDLQVLSASALVDRAVILDSSSS